MHDACAYYERLVNGRNLSTLSALSGAVPKGAPPAAPQREPQGELVTLAMESAAPAVTLPELDASRLAPVLFVAVHGSQATWDACDFSDVDVLVAIDDRRTYSANQHESAVFELRRLLRAVYRHDPLMHHGLMFCAASDLDAWDQSLLPLQTLRLAHRLHGAAEISVHLTAPQAGAMRMRVRSTVNVLHARLRERAYERGDHAYKQFLSNVLLLPALVAAARGEFVYKRDSFALAQSWFAPDQWSGIARAEDLRLRWKRPIEPAVQRLLGEFAHPSLRVRWAASMQHRENAARLAASESARWREELERTLARAQELAA